MYREKQITETSLAIYNQCKRLAIGEMCNVSISAKEVRSLRSRLARNGRFTVRRATGNTYDVERKPEDAKSYRSLIMGFLIEAKSELQIPCIGRHSEIQGIVTQYNALYGTFWRCTRQRENKVFLYRDFTAEVWRPLRDALNSTTSTANDIDNALEHLIAYCEQKKAEKINQNFI